MSLHDLQLRSLPSSPDDLRFVGGRASRETIVFLLILVLIRLAASSVAAHDSVISKTSSLAAREACVSGAGSENCQGCQCPQRQLAAAAPWKGIAAMPRVRRLMNLADYRSSNVGSIPSWLRQSKPRALW